MNTAHNDTLPPQLKPSAADTLYRQKEETMTMKKTILYERLSHEDGRENESVSIENQKAYLEEYAIKNGFTNFVHMADDGYSGTRWDRPAFMQMMDDVIADIEVASEKTKLIAERKLIKADYTKLRDEVKEAEQIRSSIYSVVRAEQQRTQPHRTQDIVL